MTGLMNEHRLATADGRTLQVLEAGDPTGRPVLVHHGTPNSRLFYRRDVARAERDGICLISYDRPGYGGSSPQPGHTIADCVDDVRTIAAALDIERLAVWGISGGGPRALACAALLPELVPAVAVLASPAPWNAPGLDYFAGMGQLNVDDTRLMLEDPVASRAQRETDRLDLLAMTPDTLLEELNTLLTPTDVAALTREVGEHLLDAARSGLAPGWEGWWDDDMASLIPWGFELDSITTPVLLRHGREDRFVPFAHGEWLSRHIPGVRAELTDDDGHLTLTARHLDDVHAWLLERLD
jgi:pimeloyl-ACP methyl ester carboxylesterase